MATKPPEGFVLDKPSELPEGFVLDQPGIDPDAIRSVRPTLDPTGVLTEKDFNRTNASIEIGRRSGIPFEQVDGPNYAAFARGAGFQGDPSDDLGQVRKANDNAEQAIGDAKQISEFGFLGKVRDVGQALVASIPQTMGRGAQGVIAMNDAATRGIMGNLAKVLPKSAIDFLSEPLPEFVDPFESVKATGKLLEKGGKAIDIAEERRTLATDISSGVGQIVVQAAATLLNPMAGFVVMAGEGGEAMERRVEAAGELGTTGGDIAIVSGGVITGAIEKFQMGKLMSKAPFLGKLVDKLPASIKDKWFGKVIDVTAAGAGEAVQETIEGVLQDSIALATFNPDVEFFQGWKREAQAAGGAAGFFRIMVNAVAWGRARRTFNPRSPVNQVLEDGKFSEEVFNAVAESTPKEEFVNQYDGDELRSLAAAAYDGSEMAQKALQTFSELSKREAMLRDLKRAELSEAEKAAIPDFQLSEQEKVAFKEFEKIDPVKLLTEDEREAFEAERDAPTKEEVEEVVRIEREQEAQAALVETVDFDNELIDVVKRLGGLPKTDKALAGELERIADNQKSTKGIAGIIKKDPPLLDDLRRSLEEEGFFFETPKDMLEAIDASIQGTQSFPVQGGGIFNRPRPEKVTKARLSKEERFKVEKQRIREQGKRRVADVRLKAKERFELEKEKARSKQFDLRIAAAKRLQREMDKRIAGVRKAFRERKDITESIKSLERLVKLLPLKIRGKFTGFGQLAAKVSEDAQRRNLDKAAEKIQNLFEDFVRSEAQSRLRKTMKRFKVTSAKRRKQLDLALTPDTRESMELATTAANMSLEEGQIAAEALRNDDGTFTNDKGEIDEQRFVDYGIYTIFAGVMDSGTSPQRVMAANQVFTKMILTGRVEAKEFLEARKAEVTQMRSDSIESIIGDQRLKSENELNFERQEAGWVREVVDRVNTFVFTRLDGFRELMDNLSIEKGRFKNYLVDTFFRRAFNANKAEFKKVREDLNRLSNDISKAMGLDKPTGKELNRVLQKLKSWSEIKGSTGIVYKSQGVKGDQPMSEWQAISLWMQWQDKTLESTFEKMEIDGKTIDQVETFIGPEGIAAAKSIMAAYDRIGKQVAKVIEDVDGYRPFFIENYSPVKRHRASKDVFSEAATSQDYVRATEKNSSLKSRTGTKTELVFQKADEVFVRHVNNMNHYIAWADVAKDIRTTFDDGDVKRAIEQGTKSTRTDEVIQGMINDMLRGSIDRAKYSASASTIISNLAVSKLAFNATSAIKQLASVPAMADMVPTGEFVAGVVDFWKNPIKNAEILRNTDYIQNRIRQSYDRDLRQVAEKGTSLAITDIRNVKDRMMFLTRLGDLGAIYQGGWAVYRFNYNKAIKAKKTPDEATAAAVQAFEEAVDASQQSALTLSQSDWQRSGSFAKLFTMYMTSPIQYLRITTNSFKAMKAGRIGKKEFAKTFFIYHVLLPQLFTGMGSAFIGLWSDDEEVDEGFWNRQLTALLVGNFNAIFFFGDGLEAIMQGMIDEDTPRQILEQQLPIYDEISSIVNGAVEIQNNFLDDEMWSGADDLASGLLSLSGVPYDPIKNQLEGVYDAIAGDTEQPFLRALGFSEYAIFEESEKRKKKSSSSTRRRNLLRKE